MIPPPLLCPYKDLTATPCWSCANHIVDTDECALSGFTARATNNTKTIMNIAPTYEERLQDYKRRKQELMQLSKEALVDLIIERPKY